MATTTTTDNLANVRTRPARRRLAPGPAALIAAADELEGRHRARMEQLNGSDRQPLTSIRTGPSSCLGGGPTDSGSLDVHVQYLSDVFIRAADSGLVAGAGAESESRRPFRQLKLVEYRFGLRGADNELMALSAYFGIN